LGRRHLRLAIEVDLAPTYPHPIATLTQPVQLTGGIGCVRQKMYILGTEPARFTQFYEKVKNDPGWTVHTLPCTTFIHATRNARRTDGHSAQGDPLEKGFGLVRSQPSALYDACEKKAGRVSLLSLVRYCGTDYPVPTA